MSRVVWWCCEPPDVTIRAEQRVSELREGSSEEGDSQEVQSTTGSPGGSQESSWCPGHTPNPQKPLGSTVDAAGGRGWGQMNSP